MGKLSQRNHTLLIFHILLTSLIYPDFQRILSALAHHFIIVYLHSHALHLHIRFTCLFIPQWNLRGNKVYTAAMGGTSVEGLVVPKPGGISIPGGGAISPASTSFSNTFRGLCKSIKEPWHKKINLMHQIRTRSSERWRSNLSDIERRFIYQGYFAFNYESPRIGKT